MPANLQPADREWIEEATEAFGGNRGFALTLAHNPDLLQQMILGDLENEEKNLVANVRAGKAVLASAERMLQRMHCEPEQAARDARVAVWQCLIAQATADVAADEATLGRVRERRQAALNTQQAA